MRTFLINNKRYIAKEFTFGAVRQLESNGLSLTDVQNKPMTLAAAYLAFCASIQEKRRCLKARTRHRS